MTSASPGEPRRPLGLRDAVGAGLTAMIGAGLFVALAPAATAAGEWLLLSLGIAALVAAANAHSLARLALDDDRATGTYGYGRDRLGVPWGHLAGWAFIAGKTATCAAMAMAIGIHLWPDNAKVIAFVIVVGALALNLQGIRLPARAAQVIVGLVILVVLGFAGVTFVSPPVTAGAPPDGPTGAGGLRGIAQGAGFLFFAFAGYSRIPQLGGVMAAPRRTIPWALALALGAVLALYLLVTLALTRSLGVGWLAARQAPLAEAAEISAWPWLGPVLRVAVIVLVGGALCTLLLVVSRTVLTLARDRHLPPQLAVIDSSHGVPRRAEALVAGLVVVLVMLVDVRIAIGISAFCVLVHFAIVNASAWTLRAGVARLVPALGLVGCLGIAVMLPWESIAVGVVILAMGAFVGWVRHTTRE